MNILMLTNIYPLEDMAHKGFTPVVNYFCEEWVKEGHEVFVVNNTSRLPFFFYIIPKFLAKIIENKVGFSLPHKFNNKRIFMKNSGLKVLQLPYSKLYPGQLISEKELNKHYNSITEVLDQEHFVPDIILGHWINPQMQLIRRFKIRYKNIKASLVIHSDLIEKERNLLKENVRFLDYMGFRNQSIRINTESRIDLSNLTLFDCYSGVRDYYDLSEDKFSAKDINYNPFRISFVGNLIKRKFPTTILQAVNKIQDCKFDVTFVGEGPEMNALRKFSNNTNVNVNILGRLDRRHVYDVLQDTSVFIMISKNEAFGLVYLEAMLNRNIVIASKNDGFDGIIKDGINGFLCKAGDQNELSQILANILNMPPAELLEIQRQSFLTAVKMTDKKMAKRYLDIVGDR